MNGTELENIREPLPLPGADGRGGGGGGGGGGDRQPPPPADRSLLTLAAGPRHKGLASAAARPTFFVRVESI